MDILDKLYEDILITMKHARIFISSREKMNSTGIELYDELISRLESAKEQIVKPDLEKMGYCPDCGLRTCDCENRLNEEKAG